MKRQIPDIPSLLPQNLAHLFDFVIKRLLFINSAFVSTSHHKLKGATNLDPTRISVWIRTMPC